MTLTGATLASVTGVVLAEVPLDPDEETARELLRQELAKTEYAQARPTFVDDLVNGFWDWLDSLSAPDPSLPFDLSPIAFVVIALVVVAVIALLVGRPALLRRKLAAGSGDVFLDDDTRSAAELRAASEAAAGAGDWSLAIQERFRAVARDLSDRTLISLRPGSTAHAVTRQATRTFPAEQAALHRAADDFDAVRYLGRTGSEESWVRTRELDERIRSARPADLPDTAEVTA